MIGFLKNKQATQKLIRKTVPFFRKIFDTTRRLVRKAGWKRLALAATCLILLIGSLVAYTLHKRYFGPNVVKSQLIFIRQGENLASVIKTLKDNSLLENYNTFERLARWKDYDTNIHPGAFRIQTGWSNNQLINVLSSGAQTPVMVTFNYIRTREELAGRLARQMEYDSAAFLAALKSDSVAQSTGMKLADLPVIFLPNTYSFYWTTHPAAFVTRMKREYDAFWNDLRRQKAKSLGLTREEVSVLASIVQEESNKNDEKPVIAGVYLNRLKQGIPLQADPTIKFALGDFSIKRVLKAQLEVDSPYNTYKKSGLPPGPINFPEISSIESVLNAARHEYLYFCAKEDFSGYHNFAKSLTEHNLNARKYRAALNKLKIFK